MRIVLCDCYSSLGVCAGNTLIHIEGFFLHWAAAMCHHFKPICKHPCHLSACLTWSYQLAKLSTSFQGSRLCLAYVWRCRTSHLSPHSQVQRWVKNFASTSSQDRPESEGMEELSHVAKRKNTLHKYTTIVTTPDSKKVHILGATTLGKLIAHSLGAIPDKPQISVITHAAPIVRLWERSHRVLELSRNGLVVGHTPYSFEFVPPVHKASVEDSIAESNQSSRNSEPRDDSPIDHLIVATRTQATYFALSSIKDRLTPQSTILFLENGLSLMQEANELIFPEVHHRPNYILGISSHKVSYGGGLFKIAHEKVGSIHLGAVPTHPGHGTEDADASIDDFPTSSRYLLQTLTRCPYLEASAFKYQKFLCLQLEKHAVNAVMGSIAAILNCPNGELLHNHGVTRVIGLLFSEISHVIRTMPEMQGVPNLDKRFAPEKLQTILVNVAHRTATAVEFPVRDVWKGRPTDINYTVGYFVKKGEEQNLKCVMNYLVMQLVEARGKMIQQRKARAVPMRERF